MIYLLIEFWALSFAVALATFRYQEKKYNYKPISRGEALFWLVMAPAIFGCIVWEFISNKDFWNKPL